MQDGGTLKFSRFGADCVGALAGGGQDLVDDDRDHEKEVKTQRPEDQKLGAFEMAAGDVMFFGADKLIVFEGGEDEGLVGGGNDAAEWVASSSV